MILELRGLNPVNDLELFHQAYNWRVSQKLKHLRPGRMSFEEFASDDVTVMGLFNGDFLAAYVVKEYQPGYFDMHFTSKRKAPRDYLVAGGIQITDWLIEHGAREVSALIVSRNRPLAAFLEDCGYSAVETLTFEDSPHRWLKYVAIRTAPTRLTDIG